MRLFLRYNNNDAGAELFVVVELDRSEWIDERKLVWMSGVVE